MGERRMRSNDRWTVIGLAAGALFLGCATAAAQATTPSQLPGIHKPSAPHAPVAKAVAQPKPPLVKPVAPPAKTGDTENKTGAPNKTGGPSPARLFVR